MAYSALPFGFTLVADDLRQEIGGKISLIGVYGPDLVFLPGTTFPVTIPKLAIMLNWFEDPDQIPELLKFRIYFPGDEEGKPTAEIPVSARQQAAIAVKSAPSPTGRLIAQTKPNFILSPVTFTSEGLMKFRVERNGEEWRVGALRVRVDETPSSAEVSPPSHTAD